MKKLFILLLILLSGYTFTACCSCEDSTSDDDDYSAESDNDDNCWITSTEEEDYDDEDDDCDSGYAPDDCDTSPPDYGTVRIDITVNSLNSEIPVTIYAGDFELNKIVLTDKLTSDASYTLPNGYYSVKAEYKVELEQGMVTVYSVDGWDLDYDSDSYCDATCYEEGYTYLDARLDLDLFDNP